MTPSESNNKNQPPSAIDDATLIGLEWPRLLAALAGKLMTPYGPLALEARTFLDSVEPLRSELELVGEMMTFQRETGVLPLAGVNVVRELVEHTEKGGVLEPKECLVLLATHQVMVEAARRLRRAKETPGLAALGESMDFLESWSDTLSQAFTPEGDLSERAFPQLRGPRREIVKHRRDIHQALEHKLRHRDLANALQEKIHTLRAGRFVLAIKADFRGKVPGIVHDTSASGATLFIEPAEILEAGNALTVAERQLEAVIRAALMELSQVTQEIAPAFYSNLDWLGHLDLLQARASLAIQYGGTVPQVETEDRISLRDAFNPLMALDGEDLVPNTIDLAGGISKGEAGDSPVPEGRCLVISGANTGGKTVLLKTIGLCALFVRFGLPVPAGEGSRFDLFNIIRADIGDHQSLSHSLSTFSAQVAFLSKALQQAGSGSLILIDEILTGTAPEEGAALAAEALVRLSSCGGVSVVTTHYGELKALAAESNAMINASVAFDLENLRPTYRLIIGTPGSSFAFPVARRYGLEEDLVQAAQSRLAGQASTAEALLMKLHEQEQTLSAQASKLHKTDGRLISKQDRLAEREHKLSLREKAADRREKGEVQKALKDAHKKIAEVIKKLQSANSLPLVAQVRRQLDTVQAEVLETWTIPEEPLAQNDAKIGATVMLRSTGSAAILEAVLDKGQRARVRLGSLPLEVDWNDLAAAPSLAGKTNPPPPRKKSSPATEPFPDTRPAKTKSQQKSEPDFDFSEFGEVETVSEALRLAIQTKENTLDLRGMRLEEAWHQTEKFFDHCVMKHISPVVLIHGHGTGKLKAGLRKNLTSSPYVVEYRPGGRGEGWDGVTIVALNL